MAFGKDRANVGKMNLRQQLRRGAKRAPKSSGGGGAPYYINRYQPPKGAAAAADIIRLIPGQYPMPRIDHANKDYVYDENNQIVVDLYPYYKYISYYHAVQQRSCIGSEGPLGEFKGKGDPCVAADWFWWEWRQRQANNSKKPNAMGRREQFVVTVLVEAPFYKVPQVDRNTGQVRMNENTNEPYYEWQKGSKRGNDEYAAAGYERKDGHLQHWSLGYAHWQVLTEYADSLAHHCRSCGGHDCIEDIALLCKNCGEAVVEMDSTTLDEEDLLKLRNEEVQCHNCKHTDFLEDMIRCTQCGHGEQATLFDFDLEVKRTETASKDGGNNQTALQILRAIGPRPIDDMYGEDLRKPLDLPKIFAPTSLDKQKELFGVPPTDDDNSGGQPQRQPSNKGTRAYGS